MKRARRTAARRRLDIGTRGAGGEARPVTHWRGSGTILVIDDHQLVCDVLRHVLERHGFTVLTATDGPTGVALFRQYAGEVRAVLLDVIMPGMSGGEVLHTIQAIRPRTRILLLTGKPEADVRAHFGHAGVDYIQKSFQLAPLIAKLRQLLGE